MAEVSSQMGSIGGASIDFEGLPGDGIHEEIPLGPVLAGALCRRGRRRLRDIQASCQAILRFDRAQSMLHVFGSEDAVKAVRRQLESLGGLRKVIPSAVWAELMRTRTVHDSSLSVLAQLQQESGCRIHIERSQQEVRVFGPDESTAVAERLLDELANDCTEDAVSTDMRTLATSALQAVAHNHGVTLSIEDTQIVVLGLKDAVHDAVQELKKLIAEQPQDEPAAEAKEVEAVKHLASSKAGASHCEATSISSARSTSSTVGADVPHTGLYSNDMHGVQQQPARMAVFPGANGELLEPAASAYLGMYAQVCTGCGSALFCPHCGTVVTGGCAGVMTYMPIHSHGGVDSKSTYAEGHDCLGLYTGMAQRGA